VTSRFPAAWKHNAHKLDEAKIHYPFHPLFGQRVEIIRRVNRRRSEVIITLPDNTLCAIPEWMLNEHDCQKCVIRTQPIISLPALKTLRDLLNALTLLENQSLVKCPAEHECITEGASDATTRQATEDPVSR
jgi:hypothetical protein